MVFTLCFFRDPARQIPEDKSLLLAPADGTISDIETVENDYIGGNSLRIGIFLSVFNVHINRAPCDVIVKEIKYRKGKFKNAMKPSAGKINESNDLYLTMTDQDEQKMIIRQISGAIARRIVCKAQVGQKLKAGEKFGMIKFGSRTEVYLSADQEIKIMVEKGDKVKAGVTALIKFEK